MKIIHKFKVTIKNPNPIFEPEVEIYDNQSEVIALLTRALNNCPTLTYIIDPIKVEGPEVENEKITENDNRFADRKYHYTFDEIECTMPEARGYLAKVLATEYYKGRSQKISLNNVATVICGAFDWLLEKLCLDDNIDFDRVIEEYLEDIKHEVRQ